MGFQGSVESFSLADVFQNLAMNQQTGTLRVWVTAGGTRHVYFESGKVRYLSHGADRPLLLGEILIGRGLLDKEKLDKVLEHQRSARMPLGAAAVEMTLITQEQLNATLSHQIQEEIYELFAWEKAQFEFTDGGPTAGLFEDQINQKGPTLPISHLIMEAARRVDEWERLRSAVPSFREIYIVDQTVREAVAAGELETSAVERRVLQLIDGQRDVDDLIADSWLFRFEVLTALAGFLTSSMIRPAGTPELEAAAAELGKSNNQKRRAKVLERLLAAGQDLPEIRMQLADVLSSEGQAEKSAIHFSVLAEAQFQEGNEDAAVNLYKRILQVLPSHLPSRERLGAIYAKRGQKKEAVIQYQELISTYQGAQQWEEAKAACHRALELEPTNPDVRRELINVLVAEDDKVGAAREYEAIGDLFAKAGQNKPAADNYRKAMGLAPQQTHLKKKLANVMLTEEDRRARTKRSLTVLGAAGVVLLIAAGLGLFEFQAFNLLRDTTAHADQLVSQGQELEKSGHFTEAIEQYGQALEIYHSSGLERRFSPFVGAAKKVQSAVTVLEDRIRVAKQNGTDEEQLGLKKAKDGALALRQAWDRDDSPQSVIDAANEIIENRYAPDDIVRFAKERKNEAELKLNNFKSGLERMKQPFPSLGEEYRWKVQFLESYTQKVPGFDPSVVKLPVLMKVNIDGVSVRLDGTPIGGADRNKDNVYRYSKVINKGFELSRPGYRSVFVSVSDLRSEVQQVTLQREPAKRTELNVELSGNPVWDPANKCFWVGTAYGGLVQVDGETLEKKNVYTHPKDNGREVFGPILPLTLGGKSAIFYVTKSGDCVAMLPGDQRPARLIVPGSSVDLNAAPVITPISIGSEHCYFVLPLDKHVMVYQVETGTQLWSKGSDELPSRITAPPLVQNDLGLMILGCEDGNLYAIDLKDGRLKKDKVFTGNKVPIRAQPAVAGQTLFAGAEDGSFYAFDLKNAGGRQYIKLFGSVMAAPQVKYAKGLLFVGSIANDGFHVVETDHLSAPFSFTREELRSGVSLPATLSEGDGELRVYFASDEGGFFAIEQKGRNFQLAWSFFEPRRQHPVGPPVIIPGTKRVVFFCTNGQIYEFDE